MPHSDNVHVLTKLTKTDDSGDCQTVQATGRMNEQFGGASGKNGVEVIQDYGRSCHRPAGTIMHTITPDGNPDKARMGHGEHPQYRPKNQAEGEITDYDMWGSKMQMKSDGWHWTIGNSTIVVGRDGTITITGTTINIIGNVHLGTAGGVPAAKLGSVDNDDELSGPDALVSNLATKVFVT